ncbi:MAG: spherulation-specific family 4 protein [Verrucomicrobiota bacterium]|jgi:hypothetical protein
MKVQLVILWLAIAMGVAAAPMGIMVPAYFYPYGNSYWNAMSNAATRVPLIAILNPDSGPGTAQDANFVSAVDQLHNAGGQVIGYVHTSYATRAMAQVTNEVSLYLAFYSLDGFFIDEMTDDADTNHLNYYATLYQYIKSQNARFTVTGNPGTSTVEAYLGQPAADRLMTFEDESTNYPGYVPSSWVTNHLARQFIHVAYGLTNARTMSNDVNLAIGRNAGWIYFTDADLPNPYNTLPGYWTNEVNFVRALNQALPGTRINLTITEEIPNLIITGAAGVYEIQAASNFANWMPLQMLYTPTGTGTVADMTATNRAAGFYRTQQ